MLFKIAKMNINILTTAIILIFALSFNCCANAQSNTAGETKPVQPISVDALAHQARFQNLIINASGQQVAWFDATNGSEVAMVKDIETGHERKLAIPSHLRLTWQHWHISGEKLFVFAENDQSDLYIYAWNTKDQTLTLAVDESWSQTNSIGSPENFFGFTIQRFVDRTGKKYADFNPLSGEMTPVKNVQSIVPAYFSSLTTSLNLRTLKNEQRWVWGDRIILSPKRLDWRMGFSLASIAADAKKAWFLSAVDKNTQALLELNVVTGEIKTVASRSVDIRRVVLHPTKFTPVAIIWERERHQFELLDPTWRADMAHLRRQLGSEISIINIAANENYALLEKHAPVTKWYRYDRRTRGIYPVALPGNLPDDGLLATRGYQFKTRDHLDLTLYLTPPAQNSCHTARCPMIFLLHGGPATRDFASANADRNWLASRGYYVAQLNYRGSSGYGKAFQAMDAGNWGGRIQEDLEDSLPVALRLAPRAAADRVGLIGGSFSGDMALNALGRGNQFQCGVSIAGTADLLEFVTTTGKKLMDKTDLYWRAGDPRTPEGRLALQNASPLARVDKIKVPVLLLHGAKDKISSADNLTEFSRRLAEYGKLSFFVFNDEGHGWRKAESKLIEAVLLERFFAKCLGGSQSDAQLPVLDKISIIFDENKLLEQKK
jgi:dipeptidyl aminopeptidase/acylaminoacyl peptidase